MDTAPLEIRYYQTTSGKCPFRDWFDALDASKKLIVDRRFARVRRGLFGEFEPVGEGVFELKFDVGPGYRIYCARIERTILILLRAGDKKSQSSDIRAAQAAWKDYLWRTRQ